jgi:cytoskeletal protein RodZ
MSPTQRTQPAHRRARRSGRFVIGVVVIAILIAGGTAAALVAALTGNNTDRATATVAPSNGADATSATPAATSASPSPTPSPTASDAGAVALEKCRTTITAAEAAVAAARTGAGHWSIHTQARTDFLAHRITLAQTNARFKRTKLAGPADQKTFADALAAYQKVADGCNGLPSTDATAKTCSTKADALAATVTAGQAVMKDWASHLNNMALHADNEMSATQARNEWIAAWRSAPANLNAFSAADKASTKTPSCPAS